MNFDELLKRRKRPLILDGAMGSLLEIKGFINKGILWSASALINNPNQVFNIHKEYLSAGAEIIRTNTFRTNPIAFELAGRNDFYHFVDKAVSICRNATMNFKETIIAGSNPPAEDCYQKDRIVSKNKLFDNHKKHIDRLVFNNVDIIWNETFSHLDEIIFVCQYCSKNKIPFVMNIYFNSDLQILSGENINLVIDVITEYLPLAIGYNCISKNTFSRINEDIFKKYKYGYYLNCFNESGRKMITCTLNTIDYKEVIDNTLSNNLTFVGSCCGSDPKYTETIKEALNEVYKS